MKITLNADGSATVSNADAGIVTAAGTPQINSWIVSVEQLGKHLRGIDDVSHPWSKLSPGDKSAALDAAAAYVASVK